LDASIHDLKVTSDLPSQELVDLSVARNSGCLSSSGIHVDGMVGALAQQAASL